MHIIFQCPVCSHQTVSSPAPADGPVSCQCGWTRDEGSHDYQNGHLCRCRICGCEDLWRQKDFPPALGLLFVAMGIILSSIAWAWHRPLIAMGVLMGFALVDLLLYTFMGDMLVCYRCRSRHRKSAMDDEHPRFHLETAERYRQQALREQELQKHQ
ncbi:MAG: hypothetical protein KDA91_25205 [Planctomycetaceae bacterium]|nr:hypothetical protein [Planctomycetaceae bacterium]